MAKVIVTCDSTCDLDQASVEKYRLIVCPLYVYTGQDEHRDGVELIQAVIIHVYRRRHFARRRLLPSFVEHIQRIPVQIDHFGQGWYNSS